MGLALKRIYPNPFRTLATIEFEIPPALTGEPMSLTIYGVRGGLVRRLASEAVAPGPHRVPWNGQDQSGRTVAPGTYYVELRVGPHRLTREISAVR